MSKLIGFMILVLAMSFNAKAESVNVTPVSDEAAVVETVNHVIYQSHIEALADANAAQGLNWHVGDRASYKLDGGFIKGTIESFVREDTGSGFWMQQDANLGLFGKQKVEILFNKADGQIQKLLVNGKEQSVPTAGDVEVIEMKEDHIRVAAGEFDCIYVKIKDKKEGQVQEAWINPGAVPMSGVIKSMSDTQLGKLTQELTSFSFKFTR